MDGIFLSAKEKELNRRMFMAKEANAISYQSLILAINNKMKLVSGRAENEIEPTISDGKLQRHSNR